MQQIAAHILGHENGETLASKLTLRVEKYGIYSMFQWQLLTRSGIFLIWCLGLAEKHGSKWWCGFRVDQLQFWGQFCCNALQPKVTKSCVLAANWEELTSQKGCFFSKKQPPLWYQGQTMIVLGYRHIAPIGPPWFCVWHCSDKQHDVLMRISDRSDGYYANHVCSEDLRLFWSARDPNVSCSRAAGNDRSNHMHTS